MTKRQIIITAIISVLILTFILPTVLHRISFEQQTKVYVAAIDVTRLEKYFFNNDLYKVIKDYKDAGATTAIIHEKNGSYNETTIQSATAAGLNIALSPDVTRATDADLERLVQEYDVKYIKLQKGIWGRHYDSYDKSAPICKIIDKYDLTLVLTEHIMQLGNEEPRNFDDYLKAADGRILRSFTSYFTTNVDIKDYPAVYYQMYNSTYDRNARFITVKQLEDSGFSAKENAARTQENVRIFTEKMERDGYTQEGEVNYNSYVVNSALICAATASIAVLMCALLLDLLWKKKIPYLLIIGIVVAVIAFGATLLLPEKLLNLYPTAFATLAPSFCVGIFLYYVRKYSNRFNFGVLLGSALGLSLLLILLSGGILTALLSGPEYYLSNLHFRGVKSSLVVPLFFGAFLLVLFSYKKRTLPEYRQLALDTVKKIRWYHFLLLLVIAVIGFIYVKRSGNVNRISFFETNFRNWLTEVFAARPRTKDFLLAWPCFTLYLYYVKYNKPLLLQWAFGFGSALLFASSINTFCHTFTMAETMFLRIGTGLLFGAVFSAIFLAVNILIFKIIDIIKKKMA